MKITWLVIALFVLVFSNGCKCIQDQEPSQEYIKQAEFTAKEYREAAKRAYNNDLAGYLKLYEIARNDDNKYVTDWSEIAYEEVFLLLYSNPELWVKTFSKVDLKKFKVFIGNGIEIPHTPDDISREQFKETILHNLQKIKGDKNEMELIDYILSLYKQKRKSDSSISRQTSRDDFYRRVYDLLADCRSPAALILPTSLRRHI